MPTISQTLAARFRSAIQAAFGVESDPMIGISQNEQFGDYQSNAAMSLAKTLGQKPRDVAQKILDKLDLADIGEKSLAGPGFINVKLSPGWLAQQLNARAADHERLGIEKVPEAQTIVVDYSGPNIAKEMHVGHLRSTIIGDAISRVLEFQGHRIIRQNHIGDWGTQFGMLISFLESPGAPSLTDLDLPGLEALYRSAKQKFDADEQFQNTARSAVVRLQGGDAKARSVWETIISVSRLHYEGIYRRLGVKLTRQDERGESAYNSDLPIIVEELQKTGLAELSEGAMVVKIDGPDKSPLMLRKTDGGYGYATTDLAAIRYRVRQLHANRIVYVHDSRQAHHFRQLFATVEKAGWAPGVLLEYAPFGTMLGEDGKPFKTRSGELVKLFDLLSDAQINAMAVVNNKNPDMPAEQKEKIAHAVGIGAVKYADLAKDRVADYVFSFDKMLSLDGNTAPYLQYANARIHSIFRKACHEQGRMAGDVARREIKLESPFEIALAKHILRFGEVVEQVARDLKPHLLCTYLYELATRFSGFFENCPVIQSEEPTRGSRLALCAMIADTLEVGMDLLGIEHPEQM